MSVTAQLQPIARWRVSGASDGPQGADGVAHLARSAYLDMCAAEWEQDPDPPSMPVHEYNRARPSGQAYKAVWGYSAEGRSLRSCCGAACYTYRIPDNAADASGEGGAATVSAVSVQIAVDRYCDQGARIFAELSDSPAPSPVAAACAAAALAPAWLATSCQLGDDGQPLAPNKRSAMSGTALFDFGGEATPKKFLHVHLVLSDYLGVRGAWIDGGAMFAAGGSLSAAFSREVTFSDDDDSAGACAMSVGRIQFGEGLAPAAALARVPRLSVWENFEISCDATTYANAADGSAEALFDDALAFFLSADSLYDGAASSVADATSTVLGGTGSAGFKVVGGAPKLRLCALAVHGVTRGRTFRGISFGTQLSPSMAMRVVAYGLGPGISLQSSPRSATPLPWWGAVMDPAFRRGELASVRVAADPTAAAAPFAGTSPAPVAASGTVEVAAVPLLSTVVSEPAKRLRFDRPWATGEISTVIMAFVPEGVSAAADDENATTYDVSATRDFSLTIPDSGAAATSRSAISGTIETAGTATVSFAPPSAGAGLNWLIERGCVSSAGGTLYGNVWVYSWRPTTASVQRIVQTPLSVSLSLSATAAGKAYSISGTFAATANCNWEHSNLVDGSAQSPNGSSRLKGTTASITVNATGTAADGSTRAFAVTVPPTRLTIGGGDFYTQILTAHDSCDVADGFNVAISMSGVYTNPSAIGPVGTSFTWASTTTGAVQTQVAEHGTVVADVGGVAYSGEIPPAQFNAAVSVTSKDPSAGRSDGADTFAAGGCNFDAPPREFLVRLSGPSGLTLWATVSLPAVNVAWGATSGFTAKAVALGLAQSPSKSADVSNGATVSSSGAFDSIDPGLVSLYE